MNFQVDSLQFIFRIAHAINHMTIHESMDLLTSQSNHKASAKTKLVQS